MQMKTTMTSPNAAELREIASEANVEINYEFDAPFCAISQEDVIALAAEIETLRAALKVAQQSLLEFSAAQESGPSWYTRGEQGMYSQVRLWLRRGLEAVQGALGPYDDNGEYLKEKPSAEPASPRIESGAPQGEAGDRAGPRVSPAAGLVSQPPGSSLPLNRALIHALGFCVIPLPQGSVTVENRSPDPVVVTVDRATVKSADERA